MYMKGVGFWKKIGKRCFLCIYRKVSAFSVVLFCFMIKSSLSKSRSVSVSSQRADSNTVLDFKTLWKIDWAIQDQRHYSILVLAKPTFYVGVFSQEAFLNSSIVKPKIKSLMSWDLKIWTLADNQITRPAPPPISKPSNTWN